jgi:type I restriction enzyme S subunit
VSLGRYPRYRDSGVEWLGDVPEHWTHSRVRALFRQQKRQDQTGKPVLSVYREYGVILKDSREDNINKTPEDISAYQLVNPGDLVVNKMKAWQGSLGVSPVEGVTSPDYLVFAPHHGECPEFLHLLLRCRQMVSVYRGISNGIRPDQWRIEADSFLGLSVFLPPVPEQVHIAAFLERETAKIDALVAEQQRLVELLKEKRQAVISRAVGKGLNPNAPMKDSGSEWLGEVPAHWEVKRFQRCVYVAEGQVDPEDPCFSAMPLIAPNHIESGTGRLLTLESASDQGAESGKYLCKAGDVVYSKIRPALRKVCIAPEDCLCSADMYPLRAHSGLTNAFLLWAMLSEWFSCLAVLESQRVAMPKINRESLKDLMLVVPGVEEQGQIVTFLKRETAKLDALTAEAQRAIELLQERRTALISAAVTGKIDVRP